MIIAIVGSTCSGKTTLAKHLAKYGYEQIVTYTTRPKRPGEHDSDYHFISEEEFLQKKAEGFFAETSEYEATFGHCYYGSALADYQGDQKRTIVLNPEGIKVVSDLVFTVYLEPTYTAIFSRGYARGDTTEELNRRVATDARAYKDIRDHGLIDYTVEGDWPVEVVAQWVLQAANSYSSSTFEPCNTPE